MSDLPFGFSAGDDPERDKHKKDPDSGSGADPFGLGGGGSQFDMSQLGEMFTRLGEMFSGAGGVMTGGKQSGPVNYDLARQLASSSIGFVAPVPEKSPARSEAGGSVLRPVVPVDTSPSASCTVPSLTRRTSLSTLTK